MIDNIIVSDEQLDMFCKSWSRMVSCISHDLKTPLLTIRMIAENIESSLPHLINGYKLAINQQLITDKIDAKKLELLKQSSATEIIEIITQTISFLNLLHPWCKKLFSNSQDIQLLSVKSCFDQALNNVATEDEQALTLIHTRIEHDFSFKADPFFIGPLFSNLLRNALFSIKLANKGEITAWTEQEPNYNILHIKYTGRGIKATKLPEVFDQFFLENNNEIIPGLGFCRLALMKNGNDIICNSTEGEFTDFVIKFKNTD